MCVCVSVCVSCMAQEAQGSIFHWPAGSGEVALGDGVEQEDVDEDGDDDNGGGGGERSRYSIKCCRFRLGKLGLSTPEDGS